MTGAEISPTLFGLMNSNRDFKVQKTWGKNMFNSSFPTSLACYMDAIGEKLVYLTLDNSYNVSHSKIDVINIFGIKPLAAKLYFSFESDFVPYRKYVSGSLPRIDLVTMDSTNNSCCRGIEIKLTALPDHPTSELSDDKYGSELVVRPDTIVYLAINVAMVYNTEKGREELRSYLEPVCKNDIDWTNSALVRPKIDGLISALDKILLARMDKQSPLLMQPIWKTKGKSLVLDDNCFDIFMWSDFAFTRLFVDVAKKSSRNDISRHMRTVVWLTKMLYDFSIEEKIYNQRVIDQFTYDTKNDKAFSCNGSITHPYMACAELTTPRFKKEVVNKVILGGGENYLSPERRLDAAILSTPGLFESIL